MSAAEMGADINNDTRASLLGGSLHDGIYTALRSALIRGDLVPGQSFPMRALADQFGTSLIPVRDALKRLVAERALELLPNRTICVPLMPRDRFKELLQVRLSLEPQLARRATDLIDHKGIGELEAINARMQAAAGKLDAKTYLGANYEFHFRLYEAAESSVALPIVESLWMQIGPFLHGVFADAGGIKAARDNHAEVLAAVRRGDSVSAAAALHRDLADAADVILARVAFVTDKETLARRQYAVPARETREAI